MKPIDILTVALIIIIGGYSIRKVYLVNKRESMNQCYRCGKSLEGIEFGYIRDGQSAFTMKDRKSCIDCINKTKSSTLKLLVYFIIVAIVASIISVLLGN